MPKTIVIWPPEKTCKYVARDEKELTFEFSLEPNEKVVEK